MCVCVCVCVCIHKWRFIYGNHHFILLTLYDVCTQSASYV